MGDARRPHTDDTSGLSCFKRPLSHAACEAFAGHGVAARDVVTTACGAHGVAGGHGVLGTHVVATAQRFGAGDLSAASHGVAGHAVA